MGITENGAETAQTRYEAMENEETLPLYQEPGLDPEAAVKVPSPTAGPDEVRDYLVHILVSVRRLPVDYARRAAARWNAGSGRELRNYTPLLYREVFGFEDGWIIYKEVKGSLYRERNKGSKSRRYMAIMIPILLAVDLAAALTLSKGPDNIIILFAAVSSLVFGVPILIGISIALCTTPVDPEAEAERELQRLGQPQ